MLSASSEILLEEMQDDNVTYNVTLPYKDDNMSSKTSSLKPLSENEPNHHLQISF